MSSGKKAFLLIMLILIVDQILKIWVKTNMQIGDEIHFLGKRGMLHFIENNGMAFGMEMGGKTGKVIYQNLGFGILFIVLGIAAGAAAWLPAMYAAVLHFVGSLIVVFNSARLVRYGEELEHEPHV